MQNISYYKVIRFTCVLDISCIIVIIPIHYCDFYEHSDDEYCFDNNKQPLPSSIIFYFHYNILCNHQQNLI